MKSAASWAEGRAPKHIQVACYPRALQKHPVPIPFGLSEWVTIETHAVGSRHAGVFAPLGRMKARLVFGGFLRVINNEELAPSFAGIELKSELLADRGNQRRAVRGISCGVELDGLYNRLDYTLYNPSIANPSDNRTIANS